MPRSSSHRRFSKHDDSDEPFTPKEVAVFTLAAALLVYWFIFRPKQPPSAPLPSKTNEVAGRAQIPQSESTQRPHRESKGRSTPAASRQRPDKAQKRAATPAALQGTGPPNRDALKEFKKVQPLVKGIYTHKDGRSEVVDVRETYDEATGGGYAIYIPSLGRERDVLPAKLDCGPGAARACADVPLGTFLNDEPAAAGASESPVPLPQDPDHLLESELSALLQETPAGPRAVDAQDNPGGGGRDQAGGVS